MERLLLWCGAVQALWVSSGAGSRRGLARRAAESDADALLAEAARLRKEVQSLEAEFAPPQELEPEPEPEPPELRAGVAPDEVIPFDGKVFSARITLEQFDGSERSTPAEWRPWFDRRTSVMFQRRLALPLGIVLEEGGDGRVVVVEVAEDGAGAAAEIRAGDVLRACSAVTSSLRYGSAVFPLAGATPELRRQLAPCDMVPFDDVMDTLRSNLEAPPGEEPRDCVLVLEREA